MKLSFVTFAPFHTHDSSFVRALDSLFRSLTDRANGTLTSNVNFIDATSGAKSYLLPDGQSNTDTAISVVKTDASGNAVTIYPLGSDLIKATTTLVLAAQGDSARLVYSQATRTWWTA